MAQAIDSPPPQLARATLDFLRRHAPFNDMDDAALGLIASARLGYYPQGAVVVGPASGVVDTLYIVQRGLVRGRAPNARPDEPGFEFAPGEMFPISAMLAKRAATRSYEVAEDLFCYELDAVRVEKLMATSPVFDQFCRRHIDSLLRQARSALRASYHNTVVSDQPLMQPLASAVRRKPIACTADTALRAVVALMRDQRISAVAVIDVDGVPQGVFTERDLVRLVADTLTDFDRPIGAYMTPNPICMPTTATLYEAALVMAQNGIRHLLVCEGPRLVGVVSERALFALQRQSMREVITAINLADDLDALQAAARDIRVLAHNLLVQGVGAEPLTQLIATLNDRLTERIVGREAARHDLSGLALCWLALGSEGRHEQTFSTDQDNAIIFESSLGADDVRARLAPFANAVNEALAACGFPLCKGDIMARNPRWCLSATEWRKRFSDWVRNPVPEALLNASIFFDFRPLWGEARLGHELRIWLNELVHGDERFFRVMAQNALQSQPPLGFFGDVQTSGEGAERGTIDLKAQGTRVVTDAARIFGLATGAEGTNTAARIRHAGRVRGVPVEETEAVIEAFHFLLMLRLRHQNVGPGETLHSNRIDPKSLNELDRQILKEALRQARKVQRRLALDYQL